jgi:hypothetical protein
MRLNLRDMAYVRAAILDLATFRVDGCARVEVGHSPLTSLLDGARAIYPDRTAVASDALLSPAAATSKAEATRRAWKPDDIAAAPRILGVDVARFGDDAS